MHRERLESFTSPIFAVLLEADMFARYPINVAAESYDTAMNGLSKDRLAKLYDRFRKNKEQSSSIGAVQAHIRDIHYSLGDCSCEKLTNDSEWKDALART